MTDSLTVPSRPHDGAAGRPVLHPDGTWCGPPLATWGARVAAAMVDSALWYALVVPALFVGAGAAQAASLFAAAVLAVLNGLGRTPGKRLLGLRLVRLDDGRVLGVPRGVARHFLHLLDVLSLGLGYLWPLWDRTGQTFADRIIGSVVIVDRPRLAPPSPPTV